MSANLGEKRAGDGGSTLDEGTRRSLGVLACLQLRILRSCRRGLKFALAHQLIDWAARSLTGVMVFAEFQHRFFIVLAAFEQFHSPTTKKSSQLCPTERDASGRPGVCARGIRAWEDCFRRKAAYN